MINGLDRINYDQLSKATTQSILDFTICVFTYYDGSDKSWINKCGEHPGNRFPYSGMIWTFICISGKSVAVSFIYLSSPSVYKFWFDKLGFGNKSNKYSVIVVQNRTGSRKVKPGTGSISEK